MNHSTVWPSYDDFCTCGVAEVVDAGCLEVCAQDRKHAKDPYAEEGNCCSVGFTAQYGLVDAAWDVHCDSIEEATKPSSGMHGIGEGDTTASSAVGATALLHDCPVGNTCCNIDCDSAAIDRAVYTAESHGATLGPLLFRCFSDVDTKRWPSYAAPAWVAGLELAGVWEPLPQDQKAHGRGHELFTVLHDWCNVPNMFDDAAPGDGFRRDSSTESAARGGQRLLHAGNQFKASCALSNKGSQCKVGFRSMPRHRAGECVGKISGDVSDKQIPFDPGGMASGDRNCFIYKIDDGTSRQALTGE